MVQLDTGPLDMGPLDMGPLVMAQLAMDLWEVMAQQAMVA